LQQRQLGRQEAFSDDAREVGEVVAHGALVSQIRRPAR
jgi:hypothetical protein